MRGDIPLGRSVAEYACQNCGKKFHPLYTSARKFCSVKCVGEANSNRQARLRHAEAAAKAGSMTPDELMQYLADLPEFEEDEL